MIITLFQQERTFKIGREGSETRLKTKWKPNTSKTTETQGPCPGLMGFCISALTVCLHMEVALKVVGQTKTGIKFSLRGRERQSGRSLGTPPGEGEGQGTRLRRLDVRLRRLGGLSLQPP